MAAHDGTGAPRQSRTTGYHNLLPDHSTADDAWIPDPPTYDMACSARHTAPALVSPDVPPGHERLPHYACSLEDSTVSHVKWERNNPFDSIHHSNWSEIFLVLQGTRLALHQVQTPNLFSKTKFIVSPGRLIRSFTLQHAEVGIASDHKKYELVSRSPMTTLLSEAMQNRMKQTEPHLFEPVRMYVVRLRVECDQILLRFKSWDERAKWIDHLCAAIDISPPLDERSEPSKHTLPRRRRHRHQRAGQEAARAHLASLVEQQERIIRERFPHLLPAEDDNDVQEETNEDPEADDLDTSVVNNEREPQSAVSIDSTSRHPFHSFAHAQPAAERDDTSDFIREIQHYLSTPSPVRTILTPLDPTISTFSKLPPTPQLDLPGEARYRRRCMPSLLHASRRANNDVVIHAGARWRIDWDARLLRPWPEPPPRYCAEEAEDVEPPGPTISFAANGTALREKASKPLLRKSRSSAEVGRNAGGAAITAVKSSGQTTESSSAESSLNAPEEGGRARGLLKDMGRRIRIGRRKPGEDAKASEPVRPSKEAGVRDEGLRLLV